MIAAALCHIATSRSNGSSNSRSTPLPRTPEKRTHAISYLCLGTSSASMLLRRTQPGHPPALCTQDIGHRERREDMPTGSACHDQY